MKNDYPDYKDSQISKKTNKTSPEEIEKVFADDLSNYVQDDKVQKDKENFKGTQEILKAFNDFKNTESKEEKLNFKNDFFRAIQTIIVRKERIRYSQITEFIYVQMSSGPDSIKCGEKVQFLETWISGEDIEENQRNIIFKVYDHANLAMSQSEYMASKKKMESLQTASEKFEREFEIRNEELEKLAEKIEESQSNLAKINIDVVSVLGVFTGLAFITFGGLSLAGNVGSLLSSETHLSKIMISVCLIGFVLTNALVICMQYIKNIVNSGSKLSEIFFYRDANNKLHLGFYLWINITYLIFFFLMFLLGHHFTFIR